MSISPFAKAATYDTYRSYYVKGPFCSVVGGACAADTDFDGGFFQNPAVLTATADQFDFDFDFETGAHLERGIQNVQNGVETSAMGALAFSLRDIGFGVSATQTRDASDGTVGDQQLHVENWQTTINFPFAYRLSDKLNIGVALVLFQSQETYDPFNGANLHFQNQSQQGWSLGARLGFLYQIQSHLYVGSWFQTPIQFDNKFFVTGTVDNQTTNVTDDESLRLPPLWVAGLSWQPDDDRITLLFQLDVIAPTQGGELQSYSSLATMILNQPAIAKGQTIAFEPRVGIKYNLFYNGTVFGGAYLESTRIAGQSPQPHVTSGISYKAPLGWKYWDFIELMAGVDVANDFDQVFLTFR